ncbi:MAG: 1-(5-phosphoribosyl)-5-[(5-phosphoribosylamino)methylideneamino] imidazole-4-carboxamide isomerase [Spirochaetes bacterium]|nr:1-(5-phosphoribosyl)-5-[(5-phosphoribosylamino)methylideneamino] imidazole-4-carboxamide isomerase [Spirochaetota bacterium]
MRGTARLRARRLRRTAAESAPAGSAPAAGPPDSRPFLVVPAIDLRAGRCVRLVQGSFSSATVFPVDPAEQARRFVEAGVRMIHVVDLDAAEGKGLDNRAAISAIRAAVPCALEVGGGVRSDDDARRLVDLGVERIVVGTVLAGSPRTVGGWVDRFGRRFVAGIDARAGRVRVAGWTADGGIVETDLAGRLAELGIIGLVYTSIAVDGTMAGPDVVRTAEVARAAGLPTLLSGGIGCEVDVEAAAGADPLVVGAIVGRAMYEGRVDLARLLARFPQPQVG